MVDFVRGIAQQPLDTYYISWFAIDSAVGKK
jgi:hypothetical protein